MVYQKDLSFLNRPEILQFAFPLVLFSSYGLENLLYSPSKLIIESGSADNFRPLWEHLLRDSEKEILLNEENCLLNKMKIRRVKKPTFIIHGQKDSIVCPAEGKELFKNSGAENKELLIIPDANHNTIIGAGQYFPKIKKFVEDYG